MSSRNRKYPSGSEKRKRKKRDEDKIKSQNGSMDKYLKSNTSTSNLARNLDEWAIVVVEEAPEEANGLPQPAAPSSKKSRCGRPRRNPPAPLRRRASLLRPCASLLWAGNSICHGTRGGPGSTYVVAATVLHAADERPPATEDHGQAQGQAAAVPSAQCTPPPSTMHQMFDEMPTSAANVMIWLIDYKRALMRVTLRVQKENLHQTLWKRRGHLFGRKKEKARLKKEKVHAKTPLI